MTPSRFKISAVSPALAKIAQTRGKFGLAGRMVYISKKYVAMDQSTILPLQVWGALSHAPSPLLTRDASGHSVKYTAMASCALREPNSELMHCISRFSFSASGASVILPIETPDRGRGKSRRKQAHGERDEKRSEMVQSVDGVFGRDTVVKQLVHWHFERSRHFL
jgi:hypothetical protein